MKRMRVLLLAVLFVLLLSFACAEEQPATATVDGFTIRVQEDGCVITDVDESIIADGILIIPEELDGKRVNSFQPSIIKEGLKMVIYSKNTGIFADEDHAPDATLRFNRMRYAGFRDLSASEMDRLPDMQKGEYAVTDFSQVTVSRNGSVSTSFDGTSFLSETDIPQELFGQKVYNLINPSRIAKTEGDWVFTYEDDYVNLRQYTGSGEEIFIIPNEMSGIPVSTVNIFAIPETVKYVYMEDSVTLSAYKEDNPDSKDKDFIMVTVYSYEKAAKYNSYLLERDSSFTEGTYEAYSIYRYQYTASDGELRLIDLNDFIPRDDFPAEIYGAPLLLNYISNKVSVTEGEYVYTKDSDDDLFYISGPVTDDGILIVPRKIGDKEVNRFYLSRIPENVSEVMVPYRCYSWDNSHITHEIRVYTYKDYDMIHSEETIYGDEKMVQPGEYLLTNAERYNTDGSETLVQDYYAYPTTVNGKKVHLSVYADSIRQYTSDKFTYYKLNENEVCICGYSDNDAKKVEVPETLDGLVVVGISSLNSYRVINTDKAEEIILPSCLRILGYYAIDSGKLKKLTLPAELKQISSEAIWAPNLKELKIPDGVESIGYRFLYSWDIRKIDIPNSVTNIAAGAFTYMGRIGSITLPSELTVIADEMCRECSKLGAIKIPANVTEIGKNAFNGCSRLASVTFLGTSVKRIADSAFVDCVSLGRINLPEGLEEIGYQAFYGCKKLATITIPSTVTKIGSVAFGACKGLGRVNIGAGVTEIADDAFADCAKKLTIFAPEGSYAYEWATAKGITVKIPK